MENTVRLNNGEEMRDNLDILDFELTQEEMDQITALDLDRSLFGWW